jgi:hypothetical protein
MWMIEAPKKPKKPLICCQFKIKKNSPGCKNFATKEKRKKTLATSQGKL